VTTASAAAHDTAATLPQARIAKLSAAFFGAVPGLVGLGLAWRSAVHVFGVPPLIGELILAGSRRLRAPRRLLHRQDPPGAGGDVSPS
jgi:hypothetical protein